MAKRFNVRDLTCFFVFAAICAAAWYSTRDDQIDIPGTQNEISTHSHKTKKVLAPFPSPSDTKVVTAVENSPSEFPLSSLYGLVNQAIVDSEESKGNGETIDRLHQAVLTHLSVRKLMQQRYETETDSHVKKILVQSMMGMNSADVIDFASRLIKSDSATQRGDGLELFASLPPTVEFYNSINQIINNERDLAILSRAITLTPMLAGTKEAELIVINLTSLLQHEQPGVRSASLQALAQMSDSKTAKQIAHQGLSDPDPEVRQTAAGLLAGNQTNIEGEDAMSASIIRKSAGNPKLRNH